MAKGSTFQTEPHFLAVQSILEKAIRQTSANGYSLTKRVKILDRTVRRLVAELRYYDSQFDGSVESATLMIADAVFSMEFVAPLYGQIALNILDNEDGVAYAMASYLMVKYKALNTAAHIYTKQFMESGQNVYDFDKTYALLLDAVGRD